VSTTWSGDMETEFDEFDDAELYDDSEAYDDAEAMSPAERRRRARLVVARRRAAQRRTARRLPAVTSSPKAAVQQAVSAVRDLDLETRVAQDTFRSAASAQSKRMTRAEYATVASVLISQGLDTFGSPDNKFLLAGIKASPLLLLSPQRRGRGVESVITDPRVIGFAAVAGLAIIGDQRNKSSVVKRIDVVGPTRVTENQPVLFTADLFDGRGNPSTEVPTWRSDPSDVLPIDPASGSARGGKPGFAVVSATAGTAVRRIGVEVVADGSIERSGGSAEDSGGSAGVAAGSAKTARKATT
jgi:hypothetical protein